MKDSRLKLVRYISAMPVPPRGGGDSGKDPLAQPTLTRKNYQSDVQKTDDSEIFNSPIDSQIDLLIKSLSNMNNALNSYKKSAIGQIASGVDQVVEVGEETPLSNIAQIAHLTMPGGAGGSLMSSIWEEVPKIKAIVNDPSFMSFFHKTPEGKAFIEGFKAQIDELSSNFGKPQTQSSSGQSNQGRLAELLQIFKTGSDSDDRQRKSRLDKFVAKYGDDLGEGKIDDFFGDVYHEQKQFLKGIEKIIDAFGNLEEENHMGHDTYRDSKGQVVAKIGDSSPVAITRPFIDRRMEDVRKYPESISEDILKNIKSLRPMKSASDAMEFILITDIAKDISEGSSAVDPVSKKRFKEENMGTISSNLKKYFKNNNKLSDVFTKIISNFELFDAEIKPTKKSYTIKSPTGDVEGKLKLNYVPGTNNVEDVNESTVSGEFITKDGRKIDLGVQLLSDFLNGKSIKESIFISKINGGNTEYVLQIYIFLITKYLERSGASKINEFKNSVVWDDIEKIFVSPSISKFEYEDPMSATSSIFKLFNRHPRASMVKMADGGGAWTDLLGDPNSDLSRAVAALKSDISRYKEINEMIELSGDETSKPEADALNKKIEEAKRKISSEFPGIRLNQVLSTSFVPGDPSEAPESRETGKRISIQRGSQSQRDQIEKIRKLYPEYKVKLQNLEAQMYMLDEGDTSYDKIKKEVDALDKKLLDMRKQIDYYARVGLVDRSEISDDIHGRFNALPRTKLTPEYLKKTRSKLDEYTNKFDNLGLQLDSTSSDDDVDAIKEEMEKTSAKIADLHKILRSNTKKGGGDSDEVIKYDDYQALRKTINMVKRNNGYANEQLAAAHYYLINSADAEKNTARAVKNLNDNDSLREYVRLNFPGFIGTESEPGIMDKAIANLRKSGIRVDSLEG